MTVRTVYVAIRHRFELDIPDDLLDDDSRSMELDDLIYEAFVDDPHWYFSDLDIK